MSALRKLRRQLDEDATSRAQHARKHNYRYAYGKTRRARRNREKSMLANAAEEE